MHSHRFLIVPDKFKDCLSAEEVARAMTLGIRDAIPSARIISIPLADGGDGTSLILGSALRARVGHARVHDPLRRRIRVTWHLRGHTAYLDFASASGLHLVPPRPRNPMRTTSCGVGELMRIAMERGARTIILGVGGSATVDGGLGAMRALGIRFLDERGRDVPDGGNGLARLRHVDTNRCVLNGKRIGITILSDVSNPLLGPTGAAAVFGPQKGATPAMVRGLEKGLRRLDGVITHVHGKSLRAMRCGGAAGGVVAGFVGILGSVPGVRVRVVKGIDFVLDALNVETAMKRCDWVFTGEGRLDFQTAHGKTIAGVAALARRCGKPVVVLAGRVDLDAREMKNLGLLAAFPIAPRACTMEESFANARQWMRRAAADAARLMSSRTS